MLWLSLILVTTLGGTASLENDLLRVTFSRSDGRILRVDHKEKGLSWLEGGGAGPFRLFTARALPGEPDWRQIFAPGTEPEITAANLLSRPWITDETAYDSFAMTGQASGRALVFTWTQTGSYQVRLKASLEPGRGDLHLEASVENLDPTIIIVALECPILGPVAALSSDGAADRLALPVSLGVELLNPLNLLGTLPPELDAGLRFFHPQGFLGMTLQDLAWYAEGAGGFRLSARDPILALKIFDIHRAPNSGACLVSITHLQQDLTLGRGLDPGYPIVIGALDGGSWREAAETYRSWAIDAHGIPTLVRHHQTLPSSSTGGVLGEIGLASFELGSSYEGVPFDQADWFEQLGDAVERPILHVIGWDWTNNAFTSSANYGEWETFFPSRFHTGNLAAISHGDRVAPYVWDQWLNWFRFDHIPFAQDSFLWPPRTVGGYVYLDPGDPEWRAFHRARAAELRQTLSSSLIYHDISVNNLVPYCFSTRHGHAPGDSVELMARYRDLMRAAKEGLGSHAAVGAELACEAYVGVQDYALGEQAGPTGGLAMRPFIPWIKSGQAREIPYFQHVYHELGPVIMDGWTRLSGDDTGQDEIGEIAHFVLARQVLLFGGLPMLSYGPFIGGTGGPELFPGEAGPSYRLQYNPTAPYVRGSPTHAVDPAKIALVNELAAARTGFARRFLQGGRLRLPLSLPPLDDLVFGYRGIGPGNRGSFPVPRVVHGAFSTQETLGFTFLNLHASEPISLDVLIDPASYGLTQPVYRLRVLTRAGVLEERDFQGKTTLTLELAPRLVVLVTVD